MGLSFRIYTFSDGKYPLMLKEMFKEYNISDFYGCYVDDSRLPIVLRKVSEIIGKSTEKTG